MPDAITSRHMIPTLAVLTCMVLGITFSDHELKAPTYPRAPRVPIDGTWYPCTLPNQDSGGTSLLCAVQWGDAP
jgi:hypothetical protein